MIPIEWNYASAGRSLGETIGIVHGVIGALAINSLWARAYAKQARLIQRKYKGAAQRNLKYYLSE